jgi:glycosyltransferase involved in cell wall biosynthesis
MPDLYVAVPSGDWHADPSTGAGRVWEFVLRELKKEIKLRRTPVETFNSWKRFAQRRPSVWLVRGHRGGIDVREPVVSIVHGTPWTTAPRFWEMVDRTSMEAFIASTESSLRRSSFVIVPSAYARDALLSGYDFPPERVVAVHHGVDTRTFHPEHDGGRQLVSAALGRPAPYLLFVSVTSPHKNLETLLLAVQRLARRGLPHALAVGGASAPSPNEPLGRLSAAISDRVVWLGRLDDHALAALMAGADAFCLPSFFDSFGLTVLEALACGTPVLVSNRGALPEVVGDAAMVTAPTVDAVEAGLRLILEDQSTAARLRAAGPARAKEMSWARTARGWLSVLERAAEEHPAKPSTLAPTHRN